MLNTKLFGKSLQRQGFDFFSGVPCSFLKSLVNYTINDSKYIAAANEGDAVAICAGAYLGGAKSVVLFQNSGLTNAISPLTSLNYCFKIPVLGFVSLRGEKRLSDESQHELMGQITTELLDQMQIPWDFLSSQNEEAEKQLIKANDYIEKGLSYFFVVKKGVFGKEVLENSDIPLVKNEGIVQRTKEDMKPSRLSVLETLGSLREGDMIYLATTGVTGRELYEIEDVENNLYMVGSMGCVSSLGLGLSLAKQDKRVVAIDGDGALLMRMGSMAVNATYAGNMLHILLDNNTHESTGGQSTVSSNIDFVSVAASCGYTYSYYVHDLEELKQKVEEWKEKGSLTFLYLKISKGIKEGLRRPKIKPYEVKDRLMKFING